MTPAHHLSHPLQIRNKGLTLYARCLQPLVCILSTDITSAYYVCDIQSLYCFPSPRRCTQDIINPATYVGQTKMLANNVRHVPEDHLCSFAGTENNLSLQLVALSHSQCDHRSNLPFVHIFGMAVSLSVKKPYVETHQDLHQTVLRSVQPVVL